MRIERENASNVKQDEHPSQTSDLLAYLDRIQLLGLLPSWQVIPYLAAILLLRWADYVDAEQEAIAAFDGNDYCPVLSRHQHWTSWSELRGEELVAFLQRKLLPALSAAPNGMLGQSLHRLVPVLKHFVHESPTMIDMLTQWAQAFDIETHKGRQTAADTLTGLVELTTGMVGGEHVIPRSMARRTTGMIGGEHVTPRSVAELMVDLLEPCPGERVYDPCFGNGGLLAVAASRLREQALRMPPKVWTDVQQRSVFGIEINPFAYSIGLARVVLAGIEHPGLELGDTLERPLAKDRSSEGFDCILAVPPWGGRARREIAAHFPVSATNLETLFLQHVMASLRRGGRAVIALPEGPLFRTGPDRIVRKELLSDYRMEGVVSLPAGAFQPYTGIKTSLVLFRREQAKQTVRFLQVGEWPSPRRDDAFGREKAVAVARGIAEEFRNGTQNGNLWETPVKKLEARNWELLAKRTGEDTLSRSLGVLNETDTEIPVNPLYKVAELFAGVSYSRAATTPYRDNPAVFAGLLRVADVNYTSVRAPSLYLTEDGSARVQPKHRLRAGDILISTSGTIGKLGVVSEPSSTIDAVAAKSLAVIRPREQISPQFLKCLLASDSYQEWFRGHARGATIQRLSMRTLRHLSVPVPELPIQEQVVRQVIGGGGNSLSEIIRTLTDGGEDPIVTWLGESSEVQELWRSDEAVDPLVLLERISHSIRVLRNQVVHSPIHTMPGLDLWLMALAEAAGMLQGLNWVPPGSGRVAILSSVQLRLEQAQSALGESRLPALDSAREVTREISRLVRAEVESLLADVRLELGVEPSAVVAGTENEVQVRLKNLSPLALRNISASTSPNIGSTQVMYLPESQVHSLAARIPALADIGPFRFRLKWRAERLDGQSVSDEVPLAVDVRSTREDVHRAELGTSPYIVGSPIDRKREEMFFGRRDVIDKIQLQLSTNHQANVILLEGNRRTGKTSILKRLQSSDILPGWIVVYCSFQGGEGHESEGGLPTNEVFRLMARDIGWAVNDAGIRVWLPDMDSPDPKKPFKVAFLKALSAAFTGSSKPSEVFELYLQSVLQACSPRRLLLMLDEFDKLQEGIDKDITSPQVPENIRYLLHEYPDLSAILTGSRRLKRLREEYWSALFGFGYRVPVSELPLEDARLLVTQPVDGRLTYVPEATDHVVDLCGRQPFLIQSLCNRIFERAALSDERTVTIGAVDTAAHEMVTDNEHFHTLWDYAETERRCFVLALCQQLVGGLDPITLSLLETKLEEYGIALPTSGDDLGSDLEFLRELELLELDDTVRGSAYKLAVPLMAEWIRRNIDFEDQRRKAVRESEESTGQIISVRKPDTRARKSSE